ncbi:MAG TPA: Ku protein [Longimicrobiales bacterium]|nr:Ku protein [Longimicrobiales bacterium]
MPRALWKGNISFGLVNIPVGLFPAEQKADGVSFVQLDQRSMSPIGYKRYNKSSGQEVPWDEIVKGYEYEPGRYVVLSDEDFERANVKATHTVEILDFVDAEEIEPIYFDKPYYMAPTTENGKGYALLRETLRRTKKVGIARVVIRTREHLAAVMARGDMLLLELLRYPNEVRSTEELDVPGNDLEELGVTSRELKMAELLVEQMVESWEPEKYTDRYRDDLMARIKEKIEAGETETVEGGELEEVAAGSDVLDIMDLLKRSVERAGKASESDAAEAKKAEPKGKRKKAASGGKSSSRGRKTA